MPPKAGQIHGPLSTGGVARALTLSRDRGRETKLWPPLGNTVGRRVLPHPYSWYTSSFPLMFLKLVPPGHHRVQAVVTPSLYCFPCLQTWLLAFTLSSFPFFFFYRMIFYITDLMITSHGPWDNDKAAFKAL